MEMGFICNRDLEYFRYDYQVAQVPGPLTAEMEAERRTKEAERRKAIKKAKKEKQKVSTKIRNL